MTWGTGQSQFDQLVKGLQLESRKIELLCMKTDPSKSELPFMDLWAWHRDLVPQIFGELRDLAEKSEFIGGPRVEAFEKDFAAFTQAPYALGLANGTHAITLALRASGVKAGDGVITAGNSFIASVEAIIELGAKPILVDVDPETTLMDAEVTEASVRSGVRAILPVHLYGTPVNLEKFQSLCERRDLIHVQDAAQAHGALWSGRPLVEFGHAQTYSFYPGKNLGAWGDAGAVTTRHLEIAESIREYRDHGRKRGQKYVHDSMGSNFRLDPIQAVVLRHKLADLHKKSERRRELYRQITRELEGVGDLRFFRIHPNATPVHHLLVARTRKRDALKKFLGERGIATGIHYPVPLHLQPSLRFLGLKKGSLPGCEVLADEILSLPFFPEMTSEQTGRLVDEVKSFFG